MTATRDQHAASWPELDLRTRQHIERLSLAGGLNGLRWDDRRRLVIVGPPTRHLVERISVPVDGHTTSVAVVRKHLDVSDWATSLTGDTHLVEACWGESTLRQQVPASIELPYLDVVWRTSEHACLLMRDVEPELRRARASGEAGFSHKIAALASLHAAFASPPPPTADHAWLPSYERFFRTAIAQHRLAAMGQLAESPGAGKLLASAPHFEEEVGVWLAALPASARARAEVLLEDPTPVFERLRDTPMTLLHGDPGPQHFGLRQTQAGHRTTLIDWEFVAWGPPATDLVHLVLFRHFEHIPASAVRAQAFQSYRDALPGGHVSRFDHRGWQMSLDLSSVLWVLAYGQRHGQVLRRVDETSRPHHPAWAAAQAEAGLLEDACQRWLD